MRCNKAPQRYRHSILVTGCSDYAEHHAVPVERPERPQTEDDAAGESDEVVNLEPWLEALKEYCRKGQPPEAVAPFIVGYCQSSEDTAAVVHELLDNGIDEFVKMDPEFELPGYRIWFSKLFEVLRVQLLGDSDDTGGAGGDRRNPESDGGPRA